MQEAYGTEPADDHGWEVLDIYREVYTGVALKSRPQLQRLLRDLRVGPHRSRHRMASGPGEP